MNFSVIVSLSNFINNLVTFNFFRTFFLDQIICDLCVKIFATILNKKNRFLNSVDIFENHLCDFFLNKGILFFSLIQRRKHFHQSRHKKETFGVSQLLIGHKLLPKLK